MGQTEYSIALTRERFIQSNKALCNHYLKWNLKDYKNGIPHKNKNVQKYTETKKQKLNTL